MTKVTELVDRYVAVWNEPNAEHRRQSIARLWVEDGAHFTPSLEARGYQALEARVAGAYEKWVKAGGFVFKSSGNAEEHHNGLRFTAAGSGSTTSSSTGRRRPELFTPLLAEPHRIELVVQVVAGRDHPAAPPSRGSPA